MMDMIEHGGNLEAAIKAYGGTRDDWLDLSTGISPFTPELPEVPQRFWRELPDPSDVSQLETNAKHFYDAKLPCRAVPGSQFIIERLPELLLGPVGILEPTYGEYAYGFDRRGVSYQSLDGLEHAPGVRSLILANPNNPTGQFYAPERLLELANELSSRGGVLVVDEAFCRLEEQDSLLPIVSRTDNLVILRSIGKVFGLAGLRMGFVFAGEAMMCQISDMIGPWAVSNPALFVTDYLMQDTRILKNLRADIIKRQSKMVEIFKKVHLHIEGQTHLFTLISHKRAQELHEYLLNNQIYVRKFAYNATWLRFGLTADHKEDDRLLGVLLKFQEQA